MGNDLGSMRCVDGILMSRSREQACVLDCRLSAESDICPRQLSKHESSASSAGGTIETNPVECSYTCTPLVEKISSPPPYAPKMPMIKTNLHSSNNL
eukprot:CCRYP_007381-RA/>CCRYP_007381-RA protein AED:0.00 eAED:0.00 QI:759/1/1/1/0/0/2/615/96